MNSAAWLFGSPLGGPFGTEQAQKNAFFAEVLSSQKEYARKTVPHGQKMTPPMDIAVRHYRQRHRSSG